MTYRLVEQPFSASGTAFLTHPPLARIKFSTWDWVIFLLWCFGTAPRKQITVSCRQRNRLNPTHRQHPNSEHGQQSWCSEFSERWWQGLNGLHEPEFFCTPTNPSHIYWLSEQQYATHRSLKICRLQLCYQIWTWSGSKAVATFSGKQPLMSLCHFSHRVVWL